MLTETWSCLSGSEPPSGGCLHTGAGFKAATTFVEASLHCGHRPKLMKLLSNPEFRVIVVEHRDRLMRFGFEYVEAALRAQGRRIMVMDQTEVKSDLVQDIIEVLPPAEAYEPTLAPSGRDCREA